MKQRKLDKEKLKCEMKENISKAEESCLAGKNRKGLSAQIKQECAKKQS